MMIGLGVRSLCWLAMVIVLLVPQFANADSPVVALEVDGARLILDEHSVEDVRFSPDPINHDAVLIVLAPGAARALEKITTANILREMHIRYGNRVVLSAVIREVISDGRIVISGISRDEAEAIILKLQ